MSTDRIRFRLNAALSILLPLIFGLFTFAWVAGLVVYWSDVTMLVRAFAILFIAWLATWWYRFQASARLWFADRQTLFINLPWEIHLSSNSMRIRGFLLNLTVRADQVVDVGGEFLGLRRIVVKYAGKERMLSVFGGKDGIERVIEWCFYNGVELPRQAQRM